MLSTKMFEYVDAMFLYAFISNGCTQICENIAHPFVIYQHQWKQLQTPLELIWLFAMAWNINGYNHMIVLAWVC